MSEKEKLARKAITALFTQVPVEVAESVHKIVTEALDEKCEVIYDLNKEAQQGYSLRLAVLELFNAGIYVNEDITEEERDKVFDNCALSAGIVFENGTWILKEGEGG